ncbi:MAG: hypothetical protein KC646_03885 [Candidatus Cloacimonetes bacterium]|nr:hypothetical protein [Candidatus Cloacimonadota bacterium]
MLKDSNINQVMDKLYGEDHDDMELSIEDQLELDGLQEQLNFLDQWDLVEEDTSLAPEVSIEKDVLNLNELASYLQLSEAETISLLPEIPHVNLAGKYRFQLESVKKWLSSMEKNQIESHKKSDTKDNIVNFQDFLVRNVI